jgi:hypothetical protein
MARQVMIELTRSVFFHAQDELARPADLTPEAMTTLQRFSTEFLESCFNSMSSSLLPRTWK